MNRSYFFPLLFVFVSNASALTVDELVYSVLETGQPREAQITKGPWVEFMQKNTRSNGFPLVKVTREGRDAQGCWRFLQDTTMPDIPTQGGKIIGDYRTVSKVIACPKGAVPKGEERVTVVLCEIGGKSCMPN
jgi:hypothetical protein